jgi:hypothetical protein
MLAVERAVKCNAGSQSHNSLKGHRRSAALKVPMGRLCSGGPGSSIVPETNSRLEFLHENTPEPFGRRFRLDLFVWI